MNTLVMGSVVHATIDEAYLPPEIRASFTKRAIPYHFGEFYNHQEKRATGLGGFCQLDVPDFDFS